VTELTDAELAELAEFLQGLAGGRGGDLNMGARATCAGWADRIDEARE